MDENISAPPSIKLNINEESNIDYYPPPDEIENKTKDEQYTISNNNIDYNDKENNNYDNNIEYEEKGIEEEQEQIQRPLNGNNIIVIGTIRLVFQYIAVVTIFGLAIWGLVIQLVQELSYGIIDFPILIAFAVFILVLTIKKRSISGKKFLALTIAVTIGGAAAVGFSFYKIKFSLMLLIYFFVRIVILLFFIGPLNCEK